MASLKEIKSRIASVNGTLKITSAMKMVASAKLHRVQSIMADLAEYELRLSDIASAIVRDPEVIAMSPLATPHKTMHHAIVIAFSSDNSLCGSFNSNAIRTMNEQIKKLRNEGFSEITIYPVGEKIAAAARKTKCTLCNDFIHMAKSPSFSQAAELAEQLMESFIKEETDNVYLVYNHFYSMSRQKPQADTFLPMNVSNIASGTDTHANYIYEPAVTELTEKLLPYALKVQLYKVLLDSCTAEHAARTVAMQTATDNAQELLEELSLIYNKRRQQAITEELADITETN